MSKPLIARKPMNKKPKREHIADSRTFHREVFDEWGNRCYFCRGFATDAMHIYGRGMRLGKHRFACARQNGRPGCRGCHDGPGAYHYNFALKDRKMAVHALNKVLTTPLPEPM